MKAKPKKPPTGYNPKTVPLWGMRKIVPERCRIQHSRGKDRGCAFGQCAKGLIL